MVYISFCNKYCIYISCVCVCIYIYIYISLNYLFFLSNKYIMNISINIIIHDKKK